MWLIGCGDGRVGSSEGPDSQARRRMIAVIVALISLTAMLLGRGEAASPLRLPPVLTLQDAVEIAFESNWDLRAARVARVKAEGKAEESRRNILPKLDLEPTTTYFNRTGVFTSSPVTTVPANSAVVTGVTLTFTPELFSYPRLAKTLEADVLRVAQSAWDIRESWRTAKFNVIQGFYQVLLNRELLRINVDSRELARKQLETSRVQYEQGKIARLEAIRSELTLAQKEPPVIRALNDLAKSKADLLKLLGAEGVSEVEIQGSFLILPLEGTPAEFQALALRSRPDLRRLEVQRAVSEKMLLVELAAESTTPTVSLTANYSFEHILRTSAGDSQNLESYTFGLTMTIPLPFWGRRTVESKIAQQRLAVSQDEIQLASLRRNIRLEIPEKVADLNRLRALINSSEKEVFWAQENLRTTQTSFEAGKSTALDVATAINSLVQAETNLAQAKFDYVVGLADLDRLIGR